MKRVLLLPMLLISMLSVAAGAFGPGGVSRPDPIVGPTVPTTVTTMLVPPPTEPPAPPTTEPAPTTTTTVPEPPRPVQQPVPQPALDPKPQSNGWDFAPGQYPRGCITAGTFDAGPCVPPQTPCALPEYVCNREAGSINVWNHGGSGASGKYQFMESTWNRYAGYRHAAWAPEAIQDEKARDLWAGGAGCGHWSACR